MTRDQILNEEKVCTGCGALAYDDIEKICCHVNSYVPLRQYLRDSTYKNEFWEIFQRATSLK